jgi:hypothetical protein
MTKQEAINVIKECVKTISTVTDAIFDDGRDSESKEQNRDYAIQVKKIDKVEKTLATMHIEDISDDELDQLWRSAWKGNRTAHLPEVRYNHAMEFMMRLEERILQL